MKTKIKHFLLLFLVVFTTSIFAQNNSVGIGTTTPDNSAILDLVSNNQGLLIPRNNTSGITTITAPSDGLILYNTDDKCYWFWNNSTWKRLCDTDSLLTMINNLGDTIGFIYDSLAVHNNNISNLTTIVNNHSDSLDWIYDSLAVHNTNIFNNTSNINNLYDSVDVINNSITNLTTIINNHSDSLDWIYDSLAVHNTNITNNTTNITTNTTNIQNLSDSLGWVYDSLAVHNTNITTNTTNISNLYDSVDVINTHLGVVDSTLLNKWDIYGNVGTNPTNNFLGTIDNQDLVLRTNNTEKVRVTTSGGLIGIGNNMGSTPISGSGSRFMWLPHKIAFRVGNVSGTQWDEINIGNYSTAFGIDNIALGNSSFVVGSNNIATNSASFVAGQGNTSSGFASFSTGGSSIASGNYSFTSGTTLISSGVASSSFGRNNTVSGDYSSSFGSFNSVLGSSSFVAGSNSSASGLISVALGQNSHASGINSIAIGINSSASNDDAIAFGGTASGVASLAFAGGIASHNNSIVIGQAPSTASFSLTGKGTGGVTFYSNSINTMGVYLSPGSGTWASVSDRNLKTNITEIDYIEVLNKFEEFQITKWSYISQTKLGQDIEGKSENELYDKDVYHIGVMAQDFYNAFGLGSSEKLITALDVSGVNMAAIKALIDENKALKKRIENIESLLLELQK